MEPITLMPANEAKELSLKNAITIEGVINNVTMQTKNGSCQARFFDISIPYEVLQKIMELGYSVSKATGQFKEDITIISW